jgi:hypothetical protein
MTPRRIYPFEKFSNVLENDGFARINHEYDLYRNQEIELCVYSDVIIIGEFTKNIPIVYGIRIGVHETQIISR